MKYTVTERFHVHLPDLDDKLLDQHLDQVYEALLEQGIEADMGGSLRSRSVEIWLVIEADSMEEAHKRARAELERAMKRSGALPVMDPPPRQPTTSQLAYRRTEATVKPIYQALP